MVTWLPTISVAAISFVLGVRAPRWLFWGLLATLPFQVALNPISGIDLVAGRVAIPAGVLGFLVHRWRERRNWSPSPIAWLLFGIVGVASLSALWAIDGMAALQRSLVWWMVFPFVFFVDGCCTTHQDRVVLERILAVSVIAVSLTALLPVIAQIVMPVSVIAETLRSIAPVLWGADFGSIIAQYPSWFIEHGGQTMVRAFLPFPDPHMAAFFFAATLPLIAVAGVSSRLRWIAVVLGGTALLATFSRGGYLGAAVAIVITVLFLWRRSTVRWRRGMIAATVVVVAVVMVVMPLRQRIITLDSTDGSIAGRLENMEEALRIIRHHPWLGVGLGNYTLAAFPLAPPGTPVYAHSTPLDIAAELGVPVLAVVMVLGSITVCRALQRSADYTWTTAAAIAAIWIGVHMLVETPIFSPRVLPYILLVGALLIQEPNKSVVGNSVKPLKLDH